MTQSTRRAFLKQIVAIPAVFAALRSGSLSSTPFSGQTAEAFEFLVAGDSIAWGQGLEEKDKFYTLTREWLERQAFGAPREVNLKVKAHSGTTLKFHEDEAEKYLKVERDETYFFEPEVSVSSPSVWKQIEAAADEYKAAGKSGGADLILLTGGITDITVSKILNSREDNSKLVPQIEKYCCGHMFEVIEHAASLHPNATIGVVGYFPMLSPKTPPNKLLNSTLEAASFPRFLKPLANNDVVRPLLFGKILKNAIVRSRIWYTESNRNLIAAVDRLNAKYEKPRAVFIKSPITEDTCFETPNSLLFKMGKKGVPEDALYRHRVAECNKAIPELKNSTGIKNSVRLCEIGAVGHPNPAGARAYAEAIKATLTPFLETRIP